MHFSQARRKHVRLLRHDCVLFFARFGSQMFCRLSRRQWEFSFDRKGRRWFRGQAIRICWTNRRGGPHCVWQKCNTNTSGRHERSENDGFFVPPCGGVVWWIGGAQGQQRKSTIFGKSFSHQSSLISTYRLRRRKRLSGSKCLSSKRVIRNFGQ